MSAVNLHATKSATKLGIAQSSSASNIANYALVVHVCADCGAAEPTWAVLNRGVLVCADCCQVGRQFEHLRSTSWR